MNYIQPNINYTLKPLDFYKSSDKELLQYAIGGLLYMPANNTKIATKIINGDLPHLKSFVLDLEDSLGDDLVDYGIECICNIFKSLAEALEGSCLSASDLPLIFIRVREKGQMLTLCKRLGSLTYLLSGFVIPKFGKDNCLDYLGEFNSILATVNDSFYIMPVIEDKQTFYQQHRIYNLISIYDSLRPIADNVLNIRVGGADFCNIIGVRRSVHDTVYDIGAINSVLSDIVNVFSQSYVVSGPVWEFFENKQNTQDTVWREGLIKELYKDKLNGFVGKTCIHPSQLPIVQQSLIVSDTDYREALNILGMNQSTVGVKRSSSGNRMNEAKTHSLWAKKTIGLANIYGTTDQV